MNKPSRSRKFSAKQSARLGAYLAAGLGASTAATPTTEAALVVIDVGPSGFNIGGINAGVPYNGSSTQVNGFPFGGGGNLEIYNESDYVGLDGDSGLAFAIIGGEASPRRFALGETVNASATFTSSQDDSLFHYDGDSSPDFGPGSFMGFRTATDNYGWLEVTWDSASQDFQIFSGAYESVPNVAILAGATAPIPEPGTWVALAVFAGGAAFTRWRQRRNEAQKDAA